jgi:hypothetical protein
MLSQKHGKFLDWLLSLAPEPGDGYQIGKRDGGYVPLSVTRTGWNRIALGHYVEAGMGDLAADPDIELHREADGRWWPFAIQQWDHYATYSRPAAASRAGLMELTRILLNNVQEQQADAIAEVRHNGLPSDDEPEPTPEPTPETEGQRTLRLLAEAFNNF